MQTRYCAACGFLNSPSRYNPKPHCFVCFAPLEGEALPEIEKPYTVAANGGFFPIAQELSTEEAAMAVTSMLCEMAAREGYDMRIVVTGPNTAYSCRRKDG